MIDKNVGTILEADLTALVTNSVSEGKTIEYKEQLNIQSDRDKKEFLADVSSFSNASGGDLVFGMSESEGLPTALVGIPISDPEAVQLQAEQLIRGGIQPRIIGIQFQWVDLSNSKKALLIRIPRSWNSPHRVTCKGHDKFYGRSSAGKYQLDVTELRDAFNRSASLSDQIKRFRAERISAIIAGETPLPFLNTAKIVIHMIPLASFGSGDSIDLKRIFDINPRPIGTVSWDRRYNFDGLLSFSSESGICSTYIQYYRNAIVEAVDSRTLDQNQTATSDGPPTIPSSLFESRLEKFVSEQLGILRNAGVPTPISVFVTLTEVKGYEMTYDNMSRRGRISDQASAIDREVLMLPEMIVDDFGVSIHQGLVPVLDTVWNACGFEKSLNRSQKR